MPLRRSIAAESEIIPPDSDETAFIAHRLEELLGDVAAVGHAVELDVRNVVGIEVPGMEVGRLVPPGDDIDLGFETGFDDRPGVGRVVRIDIQHHVAAGLGDHRANVGNALLAVGFGDKDRAGRSDLPCRKRRRRSSIRRDTDWRASGSTSPAPAARRRRALKRIA